MRRSRLASVLGTLALALGGLGTAALLAEVATRVVDHFHCLDIRALYFAGPNRDYGWRHEPGATGWMKRCKPGGGIEWETFTRINSLGLRDREIPYARTGAYRILLLGDSFSEALQVDQEHAFAKELERELAPAAVEVVNSGHAGYGTDNELLFYRHEGRRYRPDLVLLAFTTENDVYENSYELLTRIRFPYPPKPHFELRQGRIVQVPIGIAPPSRLLRWLGRVQRMLYRQSLFYRFLLTLGLPRVVQPAWAAPDALMQAGQLGSLLRDPPREWSNAWYLTRGLVRRLAHDVAADGARFAAVVITGAHEVNESRLAWRANLNRLPPSSLDAGKAERTIVGGLRAARIPTIRLLPAFQEHLRATGRDEYFDFDTHWRPEGHRFAATVIARELRALDLVP